jgi:hypothetical protein
MEHIESISSKIKESIQHILDQQVESKLEKVQKLRDFVKSDEYKQTKGSWAKFELMQSKGFSKKDIQDKDRSNDDLRERFIKESENFASKIDLAVKKKIGDIQVDEVEPLYVNSGKDGFVEGDWILKSGDGKYRFSFETIYAGGYNIQCLHVRTKYKMKKIK